jgi:CCR4-NOT transcription complex subunit 6
MLYENIYNNIDDIFYKPITRNLLFSSNEKQDKQNNNIKIVTYNLLKPYQIYNKKYTNEKKESTIKWFYRWELIKRELAIYEPDIMCFQEVQNNIYANDMNPYFITHGYSGHFIAAEPPKTKEQKDKIIYYNPSMKSGIAIFYKNKFSPIHINSYNLLKGVKKFLKNNMKELEKQEQKIILKKINTYFANLTLILEDNETNKRIIISNLHIINKPELDDVKTLMIYLILKNLYIISKKNKIPLVLTGDFNSKPSSCVYYGITTGKMKKEYEYEFDINPQIKKIEPIIKIPSVFTKAPLTSAYHKITGKEPRYTNYGFDFKDTLDYIFVNDRVKVVGVLEEVNLDHKKRIPDEEYPSDHILQMAVIRL